MGMFQNNTACDVYIGKGDGKMLLKDIEGAKRSVQILSPFLSPYLIEKLILLHKRGIDIALITTDGIEDFRDDRERNIRKLILQDRETDANQQSLRERRKRIVKRIYMSVIGLGILILATAYLMENISILLGLPPLGIPLLVAQLLREKNRTQPIYRYSYRQLFPFKVFISRGFSGHGYTFLHGKIYLIDGEIAYLGSLNFTRNGTRSNYETRIGITDATTVRKIGEEFYRLFHEEELPERNLQEWGRTLYKEPIN